MTTTSHPVTGSPGTAGPTNSSDPTGRTIQRPKKPIPWGKIAAWAVMVIFLLITLFPFYWMLRTALSSNNALATDPGSLLPVGMNAGGFERVFGLQDVETAISQGGSGASINFWRYLLNSVIVATAVTVVQTFSCAMAAYAFSRLRWRGRETVFMIFLGSLMIPQIFTLLPN
ncbi:MAG: carbohydrate ABC transporter permease, partial [Brachybacterium tyrofermentans]